MQIKLYECEVKLAETGMKKLLKRPTSQTTVLASTSSLPLNNKPTNSENVSDEDIVDIVDKPVTIKQVVKRKVIKKVVKSTEATEE